MHPFQSVMIICISALLMVAALFMMIRKIPRTNPGIGWWITASSTLALSYVLAFIFYGTEETLEGILVFNFLNMFSMVCLYIGAMQFIFHPVNVRYVVSGFIFTLAMVVVTRLVLQQGLIADMIFVSYCSHLLLIIAWQYYFEKEELRALKRTLGITTALLSIHFLNYPWLHSIEWFAPIGFLIAITLGISIYGLLATLVILQFKIRISESESRAIHAAHHDALTGMRNRYSLQKEFINLTQAIQQDDKQDKANHNTQLALLYIDLDGFKNINDTYGHKAGDHVLVVIAQRIRDLVRDQGECARIGGDEFVILLKPGNRPDQTIKHFSEHLLKAMKAPITDGENSYQLSGSVGVSLFPEQGETLDQLLNIADSAMYEAKHKGADNFHLATP